ncbi:ESPR-type extended signal peptide-containing protein [Acidaminococcus sp. HCP3S3_G9_1]|uniref:ESPR-type extended signal peptide-containing protein n=1 Tax=Acidaminococcus sp. HCP3S3_G9_1 TaxID=3438732 RepID=UPI003F9272A0
MNKIYKVIWSRVRHCYVVVSELAKRAGKEKSTCLSTAGKTVAVLGLGAVLFMGSPCSEAFAATGKVTGGASTNQATGENATVSGGEKNKAEGKNSSVSGGGDNEAVGESSSISGGMQNKATGKHSSVTGGTQNQAGGQFATVSGGSGNKAFGADSVVIGGTGNITGKVAVDKNGDPLLDANRNEYAADASNPFPIYGVGSVAIGGYSSTIQGNYSVGIAGGSTSAGAASAVAAGNQATVTVANGVAIGYEATASVIDSSRAADTEGRIVSFGHKKGDVYYTVQYQNHTVTENTYDSDAYNRLVNVADGIDDHDVVVMEQLTKAKAEAVATAKNQIKVKGDETNVHAEETTDQDGVQTTTISLKPKVTLKDSTDTTGAKQVVLDGTAGTISAGLSTDTGNFISLDGTQGLAKVGAIQIGNQSFTYDYMKPGSLNDDGATLKLESVRASASGNFVTGLSNRTWTPGNYVTGRAATEDQLEQAGRHFLSIKTAYKDDDGNSITPVAENSLANYYNDGASGSASMAFGVGTTASGDLSLSMGVNSAASGINSLAIGYGNEAAGTQSVAVGNSTNASGNFSVAMGLGAQAGTKNDDAESTEHGAAVAVGYGAEAVETGSAAYGYSAGANAVESSAFGTSANATADGGVALGAHSVANREKGSTGYLAPDMTDPANAAKAATWVSTSGGVSLGGTDVEGKTISRQITNLAAGSADSDAVNVAQLKAVETKGMNFQGNDTDTSVHVDQGGTLQIQGSGRKEDTEYSTQNIKVLTDTANNRLSISLDKNPVFDSVTAGTERTSADGGQAGSLKIVGADSSSTNKATTITAGYVDTPELSGTTGTGRLSYTDGDGAAHTVATLGDGLKLAGDTGTGSVALDKTLDVKGGATDLATGNNIGVTANGSTLSLKLARDITGLDTVTAGGAKLGTQTDGNNPAQSGDYLTGLDNTTWTVGQTQPVTGRAATEDQLKSVSDVVDSNKTQITTNTEAIAQGLNFSASNKVDGTYKTVKKNLGDTVAVRANDAQDGHTYKTDNLTTEIDDNGIITVKMDTQLTADKVTVGTGDKTITVDGNSGNMTTGSSTLGSNGLTINNGPSVTLSGISGGSKQISDVASGKSRDDESGNPVYETETNAANIGDVKNIAAKTVTVSGDGANTKVERTPNTTDGTVDYKVSLNDTVTLGSDADKKIALDGTAGTVSVGDKVTLNGNTGTATIGGATLGKSGSDTYLTGLTNKTWDGTAVSGRAATEDQLKSVSDTVNTGWNAKVGDQILAVTPANKTLTFTAGDNIALTPTDSSKTITIATQPNVNFTTVRVGSTDGTDGIYIGSQPGGGANGSATSNITSITGLKNTAWVTDHFMSGRAATEDQLNEVAKTIKGEASASDIYVESGSVSYGNNGEGTGTLVRKNDKTTGQLTGLHDYYVTGGSVSTDGKTLNLTKNGGDAIPGIDMTNVLKLNQDSHLVAADSGEYTVGSDGKVTLKVKNNAAGSTPTDVVISGIASNAALQQGLNFEANEAEKEGGSAAYKAQLGGKVSIKGGAAQNGHTYNTDNITTTMDNGTITVKLDNDLTAHSLTAGSSTVNGTVRVTGTGGAYIEMDGSDGSLHMGNNGGRYSALYQDYGGAGFLNSADSSPRLKYDVDTAKGTYHTIATLEDGLKFAGDDAKNDTSKVVSTTLNSTLNITGGAAGNLTDNNIGVVKNDAGDGLAVKLNKDLTNMGTISFAPTTGTTGSGIKIGSQTIANNGTSPNDAAGDYITGLTNTKWSKDGIVSGRAATEDQLQQVAKSIVDGKETGGGFGLSDNAGNVVKQDLGGSIQLKAADDNLTTTADTTGKAITIGLSRTLTDMTSATFKDGTSGATAVVDGKGIVVTPNQGSEADKVKLTADGLSNGGKQITNVKSGLYDTAQNKPVDISTITAGSPMLQNGATIGDLQTVSNGVKTELTDKGLNFKGNDATTTVHRNLGDTLTIQGTGADGRDYDGGANVQVKADKNANTLTVQLDRDLNAHTLTLGKASTGTGTGEAGKLILNGTNKDNGMSPVSIGVTYRGNQDKEAMKTAMSRITYKGGNGNDHTVATLEDGLQLAGDNGEALNTTLDKKVTIKGGVAKDKLVDNTTDPTKNNNIGVVASQDKDGNTTLSLQLAKDITGLNTVTAGTVVMGNQSVVSDGKVTETGNFVAGLENTDWDGKDYVSGRAATEDQLKKVNDSITKVLGNGTFAITAGGRGEAVDATIEQNLGSAIRIFGDAPVTNEKNDGSGDFWDRSKANILTKVKKDHDGNDYVSVELQDHLDVGVHGDGKTIEGTDGSMQFKGKSAKEVNITGDTGITLSDNGKKAVALRQADGAGYLDLTGTAGTQATVSVHTVAKNLAQQDQTRLTYTDQGNKAHEVATLEDGLIFAGDTDDNVSRTLNGTLKIYGGADVNSLSDGKNIGVVASSDGLQLKLAKNLTGIESITGLTNTTITSADFATKGRAATEEQLKQAMSSVTTVTSGGGFGLTADDGKSVKADLGQTVSVKGSSNITTSVSEDGKSINIKLNNNVDLGSEGSISAGGVTINNSGIDAGGKNITNVNSGIVKGDDSDNTNAANIGDVKKLAGEAAQGAVDSLGTRDFTGDDGETISRKLGKSMKLSGGADTAKLTDKNIGVVKNADGTGLDIKLSKELTGLTSVTTGNSTLNNDGLTINNSEGKAGTTITNSGIKIAANGEGTHNVEISSSNVSMGGQQIHDVAPGTAPTDAVNVSQLGGVVNGVNNAITRLDSRVDRVGAGASALAALHPLEFDPEDKLNFAAGFGHYRSANAAAIGAFYQPTESVRFNVGGSFGGGENMVNAGVTFSLDPQRRDRFQSRIALMRTVQQLRSDNETLRQDNQKVHAQLDAMNDRLNKLTALVEQLSAKK